MIASIILAAAISSTNAWAAVDARLAPANPTNALSRFIGYPDSAKAGEFMPNPEFWAKDIDFSCASPWNDRFGKERAGTLISRRHIIFAKHWPLTPGTTVTFTDRFGMAWPYKVEKTKGIANSDIMIGLLAAEVDESIGVAKILPLGYEAHIGNGERFPVATFNKFEELLLTELSALASPTSAVKSASSRLCRDERRKAFRKPVISGDSGDPAFLLVGEKPILLYCLHTGGCGAGPAIHRHRGEIQRAMDELCPGYKLESFDFGESINP